MNELDAEDRALRESRADSTAEAHRRWRKQQAEWLDEEDRQLNKIVTKTQWPLHLRTLVIGAISGWLLCLYALIRLLWTN